MAYCLGPTHQPAKPMRCAGGLGRAQGRTLLSVAAVPSYHDQSVEPRAQFATRTHIRLLLL
jgi:hypothetical protein